MTHTPTSTTLVRTQAPGPDERPSLTTPSLTLEPESKEVVQDDPRHPKEGAPTVTAAMRRRGWMQYAVLCYVFFVIGWNDGTVGPLLPRLQSVYHVVYAVVSLIFIVNCVGSFVGATTYLYVTDRFGYGKTLFVASFIVAIGLALQAAAVPFPAFVIAYIFSGYGSALLDAGTNSFVACLDEGSSTKMSILHAVYGLGAMCSPLVTTQFARMPHWSFVYLVTIGLVAITAVLQLLVFKLRRQDDLLTEIGQRLPEKTKESEAGMSKYKQVFRLRSVHVMALFIFVYVGVESSIGGWIVTYIINERHGGSNSGYISSGFWGGLTAGRVALLWFNKKIGDYRVVYIYILLVLAFELVVWLVDELIPSAVCVSFVGFFLGPIFPIVINHAGTILPEELISGAVGYITSFSAAGAAAFPFIAGAIATGKGIGSLQPLLIAMIGLLLVLWTLVPRTRAQVR